MDRSLWCAVILVIELAAGTHPGFTQQPALTEILGGPGGSGFSDSELQPGSRILEVHVRSGDHVDSVQMLISFPDGRTVMSPKRGGSGGRLDIFRMDRGEYITGVSGRYGDYIDSIRIHTNKRTSALFGGPGGNRDFRVEVPGGNQAVGFAGRAGDYLDSVGLIFAPIHTAEVGQTRLAGGRGGSAFLDRDIPPAARIVEVRVQSGDRIDAIQAVYALPDGRYFEAGRYGGSGGQSGIFRLDSDEYITGLSGRCGDSIDSMRIHTNKRTSQLFGGRGGERDFRLDIPPGSQAVGFVGRAGDYVDAIGLTYGERDTWWRRPSRRGSYRP
jgi:hypothetical protein